MPHSTAQPLPWGNGTHAHFALSECDTLLLLVHGFGGGAAATWKGLQSLSNGQAETERTDIVFYGYDSTNAPAANSAVLLRSFIQSMVDNAKNWAEIVTRVTQTKSPRKYARVVIVAHSLGAPISRRAVLDAIESGDEWPRRTRLILFAPAHLGTRLLNDQSMLAGGLGGVIGVIFAGWKLGRPAVDDLKPGSPFLTQLWDDTTNYLNQGWSEPLKARKVLFGEQEKVVRCDIRFCADPINEAWPGHDHFSICKTKEAAAFICDNLT